MMNKIKKVLIANRGEIAIRIGRACKELGIKTVAIYSKEDIGTLHRQKADESYLIGEDLGPIEAYLDIEGIIALAKEKSVDAIHPGYGFLSENETFAKRCQDEGIIFIGPQLRHLEMFGNKTRARETAIQAGLPVIPGTDGPVASLDQALNFGRQAGYPLMLKAVSGGGGKGMRIVRSEDELAQAYDRAKSEAKSSFGDDRLYLEKYIDQPQHIEVQIIGDSHGNVIHLFERDCSIQRRHQKVVEVAPSFGLSEEMRQRLTNASLQLMQHVSYLNAGTVEFLVSGDDYYFIEVNPRVQVEHTITELVTGVDIVKTQIQVADGESLFGDQVGIPSQAAITTRGYAIQCRVTTEDPLNDFAPDSGTIVSYQSPGGVGIRLDAGDAFTGALITPYYDSLLVKISSYAIVKKGAIDKMGRALEEIKVNGLKTNIRFLENIIHHPDFVSGNYHTGFIADHPELFEFLEPRDRGNKLLKYIANVTVNGFPGIEKGKKPDFEKREIPSIQGIRQGIHPASFNKRGRSHAFDKGTDQPLSLKQLLDQEGPQAVVHAVLQEKDALITDTSLRDAHQSVLTTRMRTTDMVHIAPYMNATMTDAFSLELWGGATFDVAYNFLRESPWSRLQALRQAIPHIPFQMLLRAANAVGYKNYPDNVVQAFIAESAKQGIDIFRIFDSLNWIEAMKMPIEAALETGKLVEGTICYTGDLLDPNRSSLYTLDYYVKMAKALEGLGVHTLAIKDMAGLLKPEAAFRLVTALKANTKLPIHLHTHDTAGNGVMVYSRAIDAGVDIVDTANPALAGQNSQPSANSLYFARMGMDRQVKVNVKANDQMADYWKTTRTYYRPFETDLTTSWTQVYDYEMPGGQYSNLKMQANSLGLGDRFDQVADMYRKVNFLLGDIVKVTPSSKVVGDMALFMVQNDLDEQSVLEKGQSLDFPDSVVAFMKGEIGQPAGGMNQALQEVVLKGDMPITDRPGNHLPTFDFQALTEQLSQAGHPQVETQDLLSAALYPKVYQDYQAFLADFGDVSVLETPTFFYGMRPHETISVDLEPGKTVNIELTSVSSLKDDGTRTVYFNLNGLSHKVEIRDQAAKTDYVQRVLADRSNPNHVAAQMPGTVFAVKVKVGDKVEQGQVLLISEAMKMETAIQAPRSGVIKAIHIKAQDAIKAGELLIELED